MYRPRGGSATPKRPMKTRDDEAPRRQEEEVPAYMYTCIYMCTRQIARNCRPFVCKSIQRSPSAPPILIARGAHRERQKGALPRSPLKLRATSVVRRSQHPRWFTRSSTEQRDRGMKEEGKRGAHPSRIREARVARRSFVPPRTLLRPCSSPATPFDIIDPLLASALHTPTKLHGTSLSRTL
jgi:hypothetical protein